MRLLRRLVYLLLLLGAVAGGGYLYLRHWLDAPGPATSTIVVDLPTGIGVSGIAQRLAAAGAIDQPLLFQIGARLLGQERALRAGEYEFKPGQSPAAMLEQLVRGEILLHRIAVPEGLTVKEVADLLVAAEPLAGPMPDLPGEGSLLPETYLVPRGEPRARIVERMRADMAKLLAAQWETRAPDLPLASPEQALVLASIIEKETAVPAEYPLVASVFVNRLRRGMRLQTDPTVIYGLTEGRGPLGRPLTTADLAVEHPWNTYQIAGLPPSPIANPGEGALRAALHPASTDYLYFVADGTGRHAFSASLEAHNRNVARYRRLQRQASPEDEPR